MAIMTDTAIVKVEFLGEPVNNNGAQIVKIHLDNKKRRDWVRPEVLTWTDRITDDLTMRTILKAPHCKGCHSEDHLLEKCGYATLGSFFKFKLAN